MDHLAPSPGVNWYNYSSYGEIIGGSQLPPMELGGLEVSRQIAPQTHFTAASATPQGSINSGLHYFEDHPGSHLSGNLTSSAEEDQTKYLVKAKVPSKVRAALGEKILCQVCGATFACGANLRNHIRIHTGERPFICEECGASFTQSSNLRSHMRVHTGERPFMCGICGQTFARSSHLPGHMRTHTGEKPFCCPHCSRSFATNQIMKNHMRTHTGERPFVCDVCDATFAQSSCLATHKKIHTGDRKYKCIECGKAFISRSGLQTHERVHTGEKPYKCDKCDKSFKTSSYLSKHKQKYCGNGGQKSKVDYSKLDCAKKSNHKPSSLRRTKNAKAAPRFSKKSVPKRLRRSQRHKILENYDEENYSENGEVKHEDFHEQNRSEYSDIPGNYGEIKLEGCHKQDRRNESIGTPVNSAAHGCRSHDNPAPFKIHCENEKLCSKNSIEIDYESKPPIEEHYLIPEYSSQMDLGEPRVALQEGVSGVIHEELIDTSHCTAERDLSPTNEVLLENVVASVALGEEEVDNQSVFVAKNGDISWYSKNYL